MRLVLTALLLAPQDDPIRILVDKLGDDDIGVREEASARLAWIGPAARKAIEEAARGRDSEAAVRARMLLERLNPLKIILPLDEHGTVPESRSDDIRFAILNPEPEPWVLYERGLSAEFIILDYHDQEAGGGFGGRYSLISPGACALREADFLTADPESSSPRALPRPSVHIPEDLRRQHPSLAFFGSHPNRAGRYRLVVRYAYDHAAYTSRCPNDCAGHGDPERPWNRASSRTLEASVEFVVRCDRCCGCGRHS